MNLDREALRAFLNTPLAGQLFDRTQRHHYARYIAWAPTSWLVELANPRPLAYTTTAGADHLPDRYVDLATLYTSMLRDGMRDPFVLGIGQQSQKIRLETGNQRIRCLLKEGVPFAPIIGYVGPTAVTNTANGVHEGIRWHIDTAALLPYMHTYVQVADFIKGAMLVAHKAPLRLATLAGNTSQPATAPLVAESSVEI